jgi:hypothetical protein
MDRWVGVGWTDVCGGEAATRGSVLEWMMPLISFTKKRPGLVCLIFFLAAGTGQKSFTGKKIVSGLSGQNSRLQNILDLALITLPLSLSVDSHLSLSLCVSVFVVLLHTYVHLCSFSWISF